MAVLTDLLTIANRDQTKLIPVKGQGDGSIKIRQILAETALIP